MGEVSDACINWTAASSPLFLVANIFWALYLGKSKCRNDFNFASSIIVCLPYGICMVVFFIRLEIFSKKRLCAGLGILVTIFALGAYFGLRWNFRAVGGYSGAIFTALAHCCRIWAVIKSPSKCCPSFFFMFSGAVGSSLFWYKSDWHVDIHYKIGSLITLNSRAIDLVMLLYSCLKPEHEENTSQPLSGTGAIGLFSGTGVGALFFGTGVIAFFRSLWLVIVMRL